MDLNRGRIGPGAKAGHVHRLEDSANVVEDGLVDGCVLVFTSGTWVPVKLKDVIELLLAEAGE